MDFEDIIGYTLRIGVIISVGIMIIGVIMLFLKDGSTLYNDASISSRVNSSQFNLTLLIKGIINGEPLSYIYLGLILLILIPILRVFIGIIQFIKEKNIIYTVITIIVFFNLMFAIFILPLILK